MTEIEKIENTCPPEKYYEACITSHIVRYYEEKQLGRIFPFSISQVQEKREGYDFGYRVGEHKVFFIQYKRPRQIIMPWKDQIVWSIELKQLKTIVYAGYGEFTFYAFPAFFHFMEWYEGLKKTYFLNADDLYTQIRLKKKLEQKTMVIKKEDWRLKKFEDYFSIKNRYGNVLAAAEEHKERVDYSILNDQFCGYLLLAEGEEILNDKL